MATRTDRTNRAGGRKPLRQSKSSSNPWQALIRRTVSVSWLVGAYGERKLAGVANGERKLAGGGRDDGKILLGDPQGDHR